MAYQDNVAEPIVSLVLTDGFKMLLNFWSHCRIFCVSQRHNQPNSFLAPFKNVSVIQISDASFLPFSLKFPPKRACYREMSQLISFFSKQQEDIKSCTSAVICSWLSEEKRESQGTTDSQCFNRTNQ